jgi:hypothetical protein
MNVGTERLYRKPGKYGSASYDTERGAKGVAARLNKEYGNTAQWVVMTYEDFSMKHDPLVTVTNMMSGKPVLIRRSDQGGPCDPSTNLYWSM